MKFTNLLKASNSNQILALIAGLSMDVEANGYFLTEDQAASIDGQLANHNTAMEALQTQLNDANTARQAAEASLVTANATIATHTETIAARDARITALENEATDITATSREKDENEKTPSYLNPNHAANAAADRMLGVPAAKK